jgi:hypothetical protein
VKYAKAYDTTCESLPPVHIRVLEVGLLNALGL